MNASLVAPSLSHCGQQSFEHEAFGVYEQVALSAFDLLATVITSLLSAYTGRVDRMAIHHASARLGISVLAHPHTLAQGGVDPLPGAVLTPHPEVMVDGLLEGGNSCGSSRHAHPLRAM